MSRWLWVVVVALSLATGCTRRCNPGRLFLTVTLADVVAARTAQLSVRVTVADQVRLAPPVDWRGHAGSNSFDVDFASGYQAGSPLTASAVALDDGGAPVGYSEHGELTLAPGCDVLTLTVAAEPMLRLVAGALGGAGNSDGVGANARFNRPMALAADATRLYVADHDNRTVRAIDLASGAVSTLAGRAGVDGDMNGIGADALFSAPVGLARTDTQLYVSDETTQGIYALDPATRQVVKRAGNHTPGYGDANGLQAAFNQPAGLCADSDSTLYLVDHLNQVIRKIALPSFDVSTLRAADMGAPIKINDPSGITCGGGAPFYVADATDNAIRKLSIGAAGSTLVETVPVDAKSNPPLMGPQAVARDGGDLYIADTASSTIRKLPVAGGAAVVLAGSVGSIGSADGDGAAARFNLPQGLALGVHGEVYVADTGNHVIRKLVNDPATKATVVSTLAGAAAQAGPPTLDPPRFNQPTALASDRAGNLYVADGANNVVRKLSFARGALDTVTATCFAGAGCSSLVITTPSAIAVDDHDGTVYVGDVGMVYALAPDGSRSASYNDAVHALYAPRGLAVDDQGDVYVADGTSVIRRIDHGPGRKMTIIAGTYNTVGYADGPGAAARFNNPAGLALDGNTLYVADTGNYVVRAVDLGSASLTVSTPFGSAVHIGSEDGIGADARFGQPGALARDGRGNLYVTDDRFHAVRRIALVSGRVSTWIGSPGVTGVQLGPPPAQLSLPEGVAVLPDGVVVIADQAENAVLVVR